VTIGHEKASEDVNMRHSLAGSSWSGVTLAAHGSLPSPGTSDAGRLQSWQSASMARERISLGRDIERTRPLSDCAVVLLASSHA
jgi:hypothetical protein